MARLDSQLAANPALLSGQDPEKVSRANLAMSKASRPALDLITRHEINWSIVACATPAWAGTVFPDEPEEIAIARLWEAIFSTCRIDTPDPVAAWLSHDANLAERARVLNARRFAGLHFRGPGTDLHVGLADDHIWMGGAQRPATGFDVFRTCPPKRYSQLLTRIG